jgi:hypothetical protein
MDINEDKAENTPAGGVLVGKRDGQTIIHDKGTMSGYLVGKLHKDGGIKAVNKATGQPLEMQGGEIVITAPAVSDTTKREFEGKMMTNREILSAINEKGGGVSFAEGGEVPERFTPNGASYNYGGKTMTDHEILKAMNGSGHLSKGKSLKQIAQMHNVSLAHVNEELTKGLEVEKEHFADFKERTRVAKDHLVENPNYYTLLSKAGLKLGGHIQRQELVEKSKKGDTPARDLNNYNDVMDLEADGMVGGDSGLAFAKGGVVYDTTKPKLEKVTIKETKYNRASVIGRNASTISELQFIVRDYLGYSPKEDIDWIKFYVNDNTRGGYYINLNKGKKNTVANVNPETLNSANFKRVIDANTYLVKNYDWTDFFEGSAGKTKAQVTSSTKTPLTKEELFRSRIWIGDDVNLKKRVIQKLEEIGIPFDKRNGNADANESIAINIFDSDFVVYKESKEEFNRDTMRKEIFPEDLGIDVTTMGVATTTPNTSIPASTSTQPFDFYMTKIDVSNNPDLSLRVQKKAFEDGWEWENGGGKTLDYNDFNYLYFTNTSISYGNTNPSFVNSPKTEITEAEIFGNSAILNKDNSVDLVRLEYQLGKNYYDDKRFKTGEDLLEDFAKIEIYCINKPDAIVSVLITAEVVDKTGKITSKTVRINIGKNAFKPSNISYDEIKELIQEKWFNNQLDFSIFFKTNNIFQTPTLNSAVPKTVENSVYNLDLAIQKLEKASSTVVTEYNKEIYDQSLKFLYDTKATYELALKFTPESAFMYERLDIMKRLADIEKQIKNIEDMKKGGTFYMLAKILEKLERGENWRQSESADVITNSIPKSEIDVIIRSQKFKNWFGDWEKALINDEYDNVSKALTDGIPSVYHHGARRIKYTYREVSNGVLYLAENVSYAIWFSQNATAQSEEGNYLTECFVNVKNPIDLTAFKVNQVDLGDIVRYVDAIYPMAKIYDYIPAQVALLIKTNQPTNVRMWAWQLIRKYAKFVNHIKENTPYDGFLYYENNPSDQVVNPATGQSEENVTKAVAIFKSHQVKIVDAVLFDGGLDDWRFENGGKIKN